MGAFCWVLPLAAQLVHEGGGMPAPDFAAAVLHHSGSGTSMEPDSTATPMWMLMQDHWMLMLHGEAFLNDTQQSGPRGGDKLFSTNWFMARAQRRVGPGTFTARAMLSLEPATVTGRFYPELFQQGETAFGKPLIDGQHPHDFLMELAAIYDLKLDDRTLLSVYAAPVGDPALGPAAYPHRASASEDPLAPLGHHLEDATHISDDVVTVGLTRGIGRIEFSGFHGREPDELRWNLDQGRMDSWSWRATVNPAANWSGQFSIGHLHSPEALHPGENIARTTASLMYNRPLAHGSWASTLVWGRNHSSEGLIWNGYLAESTLRFAESHTVWGRIENVDRTSELLLPPAGAPESIAGRVQALTAGYDRSFALWPHLELAPGGQVTFYRTPAALQPLYGRHPTGVVLFLRLRLVP
ncbi:MAG TPA: hypothetical protein VFP94_10160 [Terriglobales bacterium]|nr:hypothetical protein [Terriglobales bacterium]